MRNVTDIFIRAFTRPVWRTSFARKRPSRRPVEDAYHPLGSEASEQFGSLLKIGGWLVALGGLVLAVNAFGRMPSYAPVELTHRLSFSQFGLQVVLPATWKVESGQSGTDFSAAHLASGAKLVGAVTVSEPPVTALDAVIDRMIEDARARIGTVESISRGVMSVGLLEARWLKMSATHEGELIRMRMVAVQRGPSTLTLTCSGGAAAQKACDAAIRTVAMVR